MSNDLVQDKINEDSALLSWFKEHLADTGMTYTEKGYGVILGAAVEMANRFHEVGGVIPSKFDIYAAGTVAIPLSITVNYASGDDLDKAIAMAAVDSLIAYYGGVALAASFTTLGPVAVTAGGIAIGSFVVNGISYTHLNTDHQLEKGNYSENYITDRAAFLYHALNEGELSPTDEDIDFKDLALDVQAYAGNGELDLPVNAKYTFGTDGADAISGESTLVDRADHLYGMGGNDTIRGLGGDDYIEGGKGRDTMYGGDGNDIFYVQGEDEAYDTFNGGDDTDTILGSSGADTIRLHNFTGENRVEIIDSDGGGDVIEGTDMSDRIDLSETTLTGIKEIRGGDRADTITGSGGNDKIYGDDGNDTLSGGGGIDPLDGGVVRISYFAK